MWNCVCEEVLKGTSVVPESDVVLEIDTWNYKAPYAKSLQAYLWSLLLGTLRPNSSFEGLGVKEE